MRGWLVSPTSAFLPLVLQLMANWHRPIIQQVFPPMALYCNRLWICVASLVDFVHCRYQLSISETAKKNLVHSNTVSRQESKHLRCGNIMQFSGYMSGCLRGSFNKETILFWPPQLAHEFCYWHTFIMF